MYWPVLALDTAGAFVDTLVENALVVATKSKETKCKPVTEQHFILLHVQLRS
jgi:hypothetical protein